MLVKLCAYRIKIFQLGGWIISHGYYLMIFHSRVSDCEAHICGQCLINSRQLHDVMRKGRGGSLVSCLDTCQKSREGSGNTLIQCLVPEKFNQSCKHVLMFVYPCSQNGRCAQMHGWIVQEILKIMSVPSDRVAMRH